MTNNWLESIPESSYAVAREAVSSAFGTAPILSIDTVSGGASGALTYRLQVQNRSYLLRMETHRGPFRNPHQYACLRIAADAGIAPLVHYVDDTAGAVIMDFIAQQPLHDYPGGPEELAKALGQLAAKLQQTTPFPVLGDYRAFLNRMLGYLRTLFAPGLLDLHLEAFERIRSVYPWDETKHASSHNDPNPRNILFDGSKLWLIDWETSYRNDPLTDIAILTENHAATPQLEEALLTAWLGHSPDRRTQAQLKLMRQLTRLYYAGLLIASAKPAVPITTLAAPTPDEFRAQFARGEHKPTSPETRIILGQMLLASVQSDVNTPGYGEALKICEQG